MTAESNNEAKPSGHQSLRNHKKLIIFLSVILAIVLVFISAFFVLRKIGENVLRNETDAFDTLDEADVYYNGKAYNYNKNLINILFIGVDMKNKGESDTHQADAVYLVSFDAEAKSVKVVAISRNTLTNVDTYDINGDYFATVEQQICLAYTYGNNDIASSENTVKAVKELLYGVPINGYYTVFMDSIADIVDAVGGVPVKINEDLTHINPKMKKGAEVIITGKDAVGYLQHRDDSNAPRLERQKAFISSFVDRAKSAMLSDLSLPIKMYKKLAANTVTDVSAASAVYLASEALYADFQVIGIEGESGTDGTYETFIPYEEQLFELILDVFYKNK